MLFLNTPLNCIKESCIWYLTPNTTFKYLLSTPCVIALLVCYCAGCLAGGLAGSLALSATFAGGILQRWFRNGFDVFHRCHSSLYFLFYNFTENLFNVRQDTLNSGLCQESLTVETVSSCCDIDLIKGLWDTIRKGPTMPFNTI